MAATQDAAVHRPDGGLSPVQSRLSLEWRDYMTRKLTEEYFENSTFYQIQSGAPHRQPRSAYFL